MTWHEEIMRPAQARVLRQLGPALAQRGFSLGGGTAVALHFGHRRSVDLDWFSGEPILDPRRLAEELVDAGIALEVTASSPGTVHGLINRVQVSLLEYRYPLLQPLASLPDYGCQLASLDDLTCMKLAALADRGAKKDFVDIYALTVHHKPLPELLALYQRRYQIENISPVIYALNYFDEADRERLPPMLWDVGWRTIKRSIQGWVRELSI